MKGDDRKDLEDAVFSICTNRIGKLGKNLFSLEQSFKERDQVLQDLLERVVYLEDHGLMLPIPTSEVEEDEEEDEVYVADDEIVHMDVDAFVLNNTKEELDSTKKELDLHKSLVESTTVKYKSRLDMTQKVLNNTKEELDSSRKELDTTKKKLEEAESSIDRYTMEITLLKSNNASLDSIITQLDNAKLAEDETGPAECAPKAPSFSNHLDAILEERDRAWTQDYQPRIKELTNRNARLEQENKDLLQENKDLQQDRSIQWSDGSNWWELGRHNNQQVFENLRAAYERLQQAHTALLAKVQAGRGE